MTPRRFLPQSAPAPPRSDYLLLQKRPLISLCTERGVILLQHGAYFRDIVRGKGDSRIIGILCITGIVCRFRLTCRLSLCIRRAGGIGTGSICTGIIRGIQKRPMKCLCCPQNLLCCLLLPVSFYPAHCFRCCCLLRFRRSIFHRFW